MSALHKLAVTVLILACAACNAGGMDLGTAPDVLWWTDHETGDVRDWESTVPWYGKDWAVNGEAAIATGTAHSGSHALKSTITTQGKGNGESSAVAEKEGLLPEEAYYSAWFYLPAPAPIPTDSWIVFKLRSRTTPDDVSTQVEVWDVQLGRRSDGKLGLGLRNAMTATTTSYDSGPEVPVGAWFHLEALLRAAQDQSGRFELWMDGQPALSPIVGPTMPSPFVEWSVGGISEELTPATGTVLIDDVAISQSRLGPTAAFRRP